jgi:hypothetical protein
VVVGPAVAVEQAVAVERAAAVELAVAELAVAVVGVRPFTTHNLTSVAMRRFRSSP